MKRLMATALLALFSIAALSACNTMEGLGKDVQKLGEKVEDKASRCAGHRRAVCAGRPERSGLPRSRGPECRSAERERVLMRRRGLHGEFIRPRVRCGCGRGEGRIPRSNFPDTEGDWV